MRHKKISWGYLIRLEGNEELIGALQSFAKGQSIKGALISGIGTIYDAELGFYEREKREYIKKLFPGDYEVVSLSGNISYFEEKPVIHCHITISGKDFISYSGHLFSAKTAATMEIFLHTLEEKLNREFDPSHRLNLLSL